MSNIQTITDYVYSAESAFASVLVDKSINFEREAGFAIQVLTANDYALGLAIKNKQSVINAVTNIAAIGISLNPAKKQAYLVPRGGAICLDISYMGLMDLAMATGSIKWAQAALVYDQDAFASNGLDKQPTHSFNPFAKDRGAVVGVYVVVKTAENDYLTHTMSIDEIMAIKARSEAGVKGKGPWVSDFGEMAKKTCIKQAYKYWPKTDRLEAAIHHLNTEAAEGIDFNGRVQPRPDDYNDPEPIVAALRDCSTSSEMKKVWADKNGLLAKQIQDHDRLKQVYLERLEQIKAKPTEGVSA